jgi:hypothetical protein
VQAVEQVQQYIHCSRAEHANDCAFIVTSACKPYCTTGSAYNYNTSATEPIKLQLNWHSM